LWLVMSYFWNLFNNIFFKIHSSTCDLFCAQSPLSCDSRCTYIQWARSFFTSLELELIWKLWSIYKLYKLIQTTFKCDSRCIHEHVYTQTHTFMENQFHY
jgi:hypothetical protein